MLGSQRVGPDLANVGALKPDVNWHLLHLYSTRLKVSDSVMPPYRFYLKPGTFGKLRQLMHSRFRENGLLQQARKLCPSLKPKLWWAYLMSLRAEETIVCCAFNGFLLRHRLIQTLLPAQATTNACYASNQMTSQVNQHRQRQMPLSLRRTGVRYLSGCSWRSCSCFIGACFIFDTHGGWFSQEVYAPFRSEAEVANYQPKIEGPDLRSGQKVYETVCALCHNSDGQGKPNQAPPLAGSEWVVGAPGRLIRIPLYGLNGPVTVKGQQMVFPSGMLAMGAALPEEDLANVLSYMRQAWGNKASGITAEEIKAVKAAVGSRPQGFTPEEIMQVPEK
jgi:mono/diheme cytochrome c family protein